MRTLLLAIVAGILSCGYPELPRLGPPDASPDGTIPDTPPDGIMDGGTDGTMPDAIPDAGMPDAVPPPDGGMTVDATFSSSTVDVDGYEIDGR